MTLYIRECGTATGLGFAGKWHWTDNGLVTLCARFPLPAQPHQRWSPDLLPEFCQVCLWQMRHPQVINRRIRWLAHMHDQRVNTQTTRFVYTQEDSYTYWSPAVAPLVMSPAPSILPPGHAELLPLQFHVYRDGSRLVIGYAAEVDLCVIYNPIPESALLIVDEPEAD